MKYKIYTDGACKGNPGPGGYAFVMLSAGELPLVVSGGCESTTNNNMELMAIVRGLEHVKEISKGLKTEIEVYSDSAYCINSIVLGWLNKWKENGWKTRAGEEVKNIFLWKKYLKVSRGMNVKFIKVKGHSGDKYNEIADKAAQLASVSNLNGEISVSK